MCFPLRLSPLIYWYVGHNNASFVNYMPVVIYGIDSCLFVCYDKVVDIMSTRCDKSVTQEHIKQTGSIDRCINNNLTLLNDVTTPFDSAHVRLLLLLTHITYPTKYGLTKTKHLGGITKLLSISTETRIAKGSALLGRVLTSEQRRTVSLNIKVDLQSCLTAA